MNERIKELAELAGMEFVKTMKAWLAEDKDIERFAELVRQDEREACAKLCEELGIKWHISGEIVCAAAIRGRTE
jgi:hypothetical protein